MTSFQSPEDVKYAKTVQRAAPTEWDAFLKFDAVVRRTDGAIPRKYRELIALAVALTTQCPYCIDGHVRAAKKQGATEGEVCEAAMIAAALRGGAAVAHTFMAVKSYEDGAGPAGT